MPLLDSTLSLIAFKQLQGKSMTDTGKSVGNEAEGIKLNIDASSIFTNEIDSDPTIAVILGVAEYVTANLTLDPTSNSQAYFATYPIGHPLVGQRVKNAISPTYGVGYEAKPFAGVNPIAVNDPIDWIYQYQSGVFYFQDPGSLPGTPTTIKLYVYIGDFLSDITASIILPEPDWNTTTAADLQMVPIGNVLPYADDANDLGSNILRWKDLYLGSKIDASTILEFVTAGNTRMYIDANGSIGIGTIPSLGYTLDISGHTRITGDLELDGNVLAKYTVQPDSQSGFDDLSIPTKKYVDDLIGGGGPAIALVAGQGIEIPTDGSINVIVDNSTIAINSAGELYAIDNTITLIPGQGIEIPSDNSINVLVDNTTIGINTAGELYVIDLVDTWGIKKNIAANEIINVFPDYQYFIYGDLTVAGVINNQSEVVIANGTLILEGDGQFNNIGDGLLKLVNLATGDSTRIHIMTFSATANVPLNINHGLGTKDFTFNVREGNNIIEVDLVHVDDNNVTITTTANTTSANIIFQSKLI